MLYAFGVGEVPISVSAPRRLARTPIRAVGAVTAALCAPRRGDVVGVRGPFGTAWPVEAAEGADVVVRRRRHRPRAAAPGRPPPARAPRALRQRRRALRRPLARGAALPRRARALARALRRPGRGHRRPGRRRLARARRRVTTLVPRADFDPDHTVAMICGPEVMMRFAVAALQRPRRAGRGDLRLAGAQHEVRDRALRPLPARARASSARTARCSAGRGRAAAAGAGALDGATKPKLAVWKFASCDGCQLSVLDCEDELLALAGEVEIAYFLEASSAHGRRPLRPVARRGLDHHAGGRRAHPARAPAVAARW